MDSSGVLGVTALVISVVGAVIAAINHKRLRSNCCGKKVEMSVDISDTTHSPTIRPAAPSPKPPAPPPAPELASLDIRVPPK